jgi:hypothetical protein
MGMDLALTVPAGPRPLSGWHGRAVRKLLEATGPPTCPNTVIPGRPGVPKRALRISSRRSFRFHVHPTSASTLARCPWVPAVRTAYS